MPLFDHEIIELCETQNIVTPFDRSLVNPASLDLRVGYDAKLENEEGELVDFDLSSYTKERPFLASPKEFLLTSTLEILNIPCNMVCDLRLKSSRGREGWNHSLSDWLDPGLTNSRITLELINERRSKWLPLYPGLRIIQIAFHVRDSTPTAHYGITGRYNNDLATQASRG